MRVFVFNSYSKRVATLSEQGCRLAQKYLANGMLTLPRGSDSFMPERWFSAGAPAREHHPTGGLCREEPCDGGDADGALTILVAAGFCDEEWVG